MAITLEGGTDTGIEGILDGLANQGRDMAVVQLAVARPDKKLFLERIGLDRRLRADREIPGEMSHGDGICAGCFRPSGTSVGPPFEEEGVCSANGRGTSGLMLRAEPILAG